MILEKAGAPPCDNHPDRAAAHALGHDHPRGDGFIEFKVTKRLCDECFAAWAKHNLAFTYIGGA